MIDHSNPYIRTVLCNKCTCIALSGVLLTSVLQESQGLTIYALVMLLIAMISLPANLLATYNQSPAL